MERAAGVLRRFLVPPYARRVRLALCRFFLFDASDRGLISVLWARVAFSSTVPHVIPGAIYRLVYKDEDAVAL